MIPGISRYRPSARWYGSVFVPRATARGPSLAAASSRAQHVDEIDLDDDLAVEVVTAPHPSYWCVRRAKQLWLTTPLAMKSPVPVVMLYIGISTPSGSMLITRRSASLFTAVFSTEHFRRMAGSTRCTKAHVLADSPRTREGDQAIGKPRVFAGHVEAEIGQSVMRVRKNLPVGVGDTQDASAATALRVEDAREKPPVPCVPWGRGATETNSLIRATEPGLGRPDRSHRSSDVRSRGEC